jgi:thiamine biosynthesis lipoprotein
VTLPSRRGTDPAAPPAFDGATAIAEQPRRAFVEQVMGLPMSLHVRGPFAAGPAVAQAVRDLFADLRADDVTFSTWKPDSPVSRIRRGDLTVEDAGPRVAQVARLCEEAAERTDGAFSAWLPGPSPAERAAGTVADDDATPRFDPTGLVKGWAAEQAFERLLERLAALGPHDALLSAGGDVVVACARTDTPDWTVAVEDPRDRTRVLLTVPLRRGAVATSGTAARGAHLVDPATGAASTGLLSATLIGPSLTWADVYATAAFVRGADPVAWAAAPAGHVAILVDRAGDVRTVKGPS